MQVASDSAPGLSLTRNFLWTFMGNSVYALCQWAVIVCLAKLGSAEMVGQFALALAVAFPITFIANLQLRVLFVTDQSSKYPFGQILGLRLMLSALAALVLLVTCKIAGYSNQTFALTLIVAAAQLIDCLSESYYGIAQRHERMDRIARSQIWRSLLGLTLLIIAVHYTGNLLLGAAGLVLGRAVMLFAYDAAPRTFRLSAQLTADDTNARRAGRACVSFLERIRPYWNLRNQLRMAWIALPLGAASMLISLNANMPRYFIQHFHGSRDLGIYSALSYIPVGCIMTATALGQAVFARLSRFYFFRQNHDFVGLMSKSASFCGSVGGAVLLVSAIAGHKLLAMLYGPEYAEHTTLLLWLVAGAAVGCVAASFGCAMTATQHFKEQVPLLLVVLVTSVIACFILIPRWGLRGAAIAALISMTVQMIGAGSVVYYALRKQGKQQSGTVSAVFGAAFEADSEA